MRIVRWLLVLLGAIAALVIGSLAGGIVGSVFGQTVADTGSAFAGMFAFVFAAYTISPAHRQRVGLFSAALVVLLALGTVILSSFTALEEFSSLSTRERIVTPAAQILGALCALLVLLKRRTTGMELWQMGLSPEDAALIWQDQERGGHEGAVRRVAAIQAKRRDEIRRATGVDVEAIVPEIGRLISWSDIVRHIFRVCEFDKAGTTVGPDGQVYPVSDLSPYGYLLVESPILNQRARLPIIHRDDFILAASVFDDPRVAGRLSQEDLLVTYAPKHLRRDGRSGSPHHVLHYVMTPRSALERYYAVEDDVHMRSPKPEKLFGPFVYEGTISVGVNPEPSL